MIQQSDITPYFTAVTQGDFTRLVAWDRWLKYPAEYCRDHPPGFREFLGWIRWEFSLKVEGGAWGVESWVLCQSVLSCIVSSERWEMRDDPVGMFLLKQRCEVWGLTWTRPGNSSVNWFWFQNQSWNRLDSSVLIIIKYLKMSLDCKEISRNPPSNYVQMVAGTPR